MPRPLAIAIAIAIALAPWAGSLAAQEPVDLDMIARIKAEATERSQVVSIFNHLTNVIGPRLTGSPAFLRSAEWSAGRFTGMDLSDVRLESWEFGRGWTLEGLVLEMTAPRYFPLFGYPEAWTPSTAGVLDGEPVYIGDWTEDDVRTRAAEIRGRVVLASRPQEAFITEDRVQPADADEPVRIGAPRSLRPPSSIDRRALAGLLQEVGAGAVLRPNQGEHGTVFVLGRRSTADGATPTVILAAEHYNMIVRLIESGEPVRLKVRVDARYHEDDTNGYNVLAEIPGVDPELGDEVVMVGAHLDSWHSATGASDNADAVASLLEAARILSALGVQPRRTIRFALWGGEEQGLLGSRYHVSEHFGDDDVESRAKLSVYFNHDPGTGAIYGWYMEGNAAAKTIFDAWLEPLKEVGARRNVIDRIGSTDHVSFIRAGLPGFNTLQDYVDYDVRTHHTNTDFYERLSEEDLQEAAVVLATFLYHAAMRDEKIPRMPIS